MTIGKLRHWAQHAQTEYDHVLVLALLCAMFSLARADSFLSIRVQDIEDYAPDKVEVHLKKLKWEVRHEEVSMVFERLPPARPGSPLAPIVSPYGSIPLDPVLAFRMYRAWIQKNTHVQRIQVYDTLLRSIHRLVTQSGMENHRVGRERALYTPHSTRVAGVCYLLKAGLEPNVISVLANWSSDQIRRYGTRHTRNPHEFEEFAFYNPVALARSYGAAPALPLAKRARR